MIIFKLGKKLILFTILFIFGIIIVPATAQQSFEIPSWIKKVAGFWSENYTTDKEFGNAITFLIENKILNMKIIETLKEENIQLKKENLELEKTLKSLGSESTQKNKKIAFSVEINEIPSWIKDVAGFWSNDESTDQEFGDAITFLIENEIIKISLKEENIKLKQEKLQLTDVVNNLLTGAKVKEKKPFNTQIGVSTDKNSYQTGDVILVFGRVEERRADSLITLNVIDPKGQIIILDHIPVDNEKSFLTEIKTNNSFWSSTGTYTIKLFYVTEKIMTEKTFEFNALNILPIPIDKSIEVTGTGFTVSYNMIGGDIVNVSPDKDLEILYVEISTTSEGELIITLPRDLIDAKAANGDDSDFFVLIDGIQMAVIETATTSDRTLKFSIPLGGSQIQIIGTFISS